MQGLVGGWGVDADTIKIMLFKEMYFHFFVFTAINVQTHGAQSYREGFTHC